MRSDTRTVQSFTGLLLISTVGTLITDMLSDSYNVPHLGDHGIPPEGTRLLYADATGMRDCSRRLNLSLKTVRRYVRADQPERLQRAPQCRPALVDPQGHPTVHVRAWPGA